MKNTTQHSSDNQSLPDFENFAVENVLPNVKQIIADNKTKLEQLLADNSTPSWASLVEQLEEREDRLSKLWSPVGHLNAVMNSPALRDAYTQALQLLTEYGTELSQNENLYRAYQTLADSDEFANLNTAQQKTIANAVRDFKLAGVGLADEKKKRYGEIKQRLSELSTQFSNNVLDATQGWYKRIDDESILAGLPSSAIETAKQTAENKNLSGFVITLDIPAYLAVMTHADNRELREELYRAYATRASSQDVALNDVDPKQWDNAPLIEETLKLRHEMAKLIGFNNYAERSLATKMAETPSEVIAFLQELAEKAKPVAEKELEELKAFVKKEFQLEQLQPWDIGYYSEKQRQAVYSVSQEELRPYFPAPKVIDGLFTVTHKLFDIDFENDNRISTWHPDAKFYWVKRDGKIIAGFYLDIYSRENKRGGAWMDECRVRRVTSAGLQLPVAYLTCNFSAPSKNKPSLLTHNEVTTLFHEFGHGLHHMLTQIEAPAVSGINGVAWDAVELPSQFLENWCWEKQAIPLISGHYETGEPLPVALLEKMLAAKNYQSAMQTVRQIEFSLFDFRLHHEYDPGNPKDPQALLDEVRQQVAVLTPPAFNKFQNSFSHIFAGGYAAGYYSYKWAEVLSSDAFSLFEEQGIFDKTTADSFLNEILQKGGSEDAMTLFVRFRGRKPSIEPLLRHTGILEGGTAP